MSSVRGFSIDDGGVRQSHVTSNVAFVTCCFQYRHNCRHTAQSEAPLPHMHAPAFSLGTCAHHSVTRSNETADGPRSGAAVPAALLISLSASLRERSRSQGLEVAGGGGV